MLYYLYDSALSEWFSPLRIFRFITFRALCGAGTAFVLSLLFGPAMIRWLQRLKLGQQVRTEHVDHLLKTHGSKQGTPTMGGVLILVSLAVSTLLWAEPGNGFVLIALFTTLFMGMIGFADDLLKIRRKHSDGLSGKQKLLLQFGWAGLVTAVLLNWHVTAEITRQFMVPFLKEPLMDHMAWWGVLIFLAIIIMGSSNAVNLTDGLDGLAVGCTSSVAFAYLVMAYIAGHAVFADYLLVPFVPGSGELAVFCGCLLGACLGFLWFNCHPAQVFMGDTGSLALGGAVAITAILIKQELVLMIVGGVFVMEAASVMMQVASFKLTGKRIFRCSPIHHHFELIAKDRAEKAGQQNLKVVENMVTVRLWIVSMIFALVGIATLKLR